MQTAAMAQATTVITQAITQVTTALRKTEAAPTTQEEKSTPIYLASTTSTEPAWNHLTGDSGFDYYLQKHPIAFLGVIAHEWKSLVAQLCDNKIPSNFTDFFLPDSASQGTPPPYLRIKKAFIKDEAPILNLEIGYDNEFYQIDCQFSLQLLEQQKETSSNELYQQTKKISRSKFTMCLQDSKTSFKTSIEQAVYYTQNNTDYIEKEIAETIKKIQQIHKEFEELFSLEANLNKFGYNPEELKLTLPNPTPENLCNTSAWLNLRTQVAKDLTELEDNFKKRKKAADSEIKGKKLEIQNVLDKAFSSDIEAENKIKDFENELLTLTDTIIPNQSTSVKAITKEKEELERQLTQFFNPPDAPNSPTSEETPPPKNEKEFLADYKKQVKNRISNIKPPKERSLPSTTESTKDKADSSNKTKHRMTWLFSIISKFKPSKKQQKSQSSKKEQPLPPIANFTNKEYEPLNDISNERTWVFFIKRKHFYKISESAKKEDNALALKRINLMVETALDKYNKTVLNFQGTADELLQNAEETNKTLENITAEATTIELYLKSTDVAPSRTAQKFKPLTEAIATFGEITKKEKAIQKANTTLSDNKKRQQRLKAQLNQQTEFLKQKIHTRNQNPKEVLQQQLKTLEILFEDCKTSTSSPLVSTAALFSHSSVNTNTSSICETHSPTTQCEFLERQADLMIELEKLTDSFCQTSKEEKPDLSELLVIMLKLYNETERTDPNGRFGKAWSEEIRNDITGHIDEKVKETGHTKQRNKGRDIYNACKNEEIFQQILEKNDDKFEQLLKKKTKEEITSVIFKAHYNPLAPDTNKNSFSSRK